MGVGGAAGRTTGHIAQEGRGLHYRLYQLKPGTGAIASGKDLDAAGDAEAIARALELLGPDGAAFELWCGTRRVLAHTGRASTPR